MRFVCLFLQQPGLLLKLFGYAAVAYISIPNYGLLDGKHDPGERNATPRLHQGRADVVYIAASVLFAFTLSVPLLIQRLKNCSERI